MELRRHLYALNTMISATLMLVNAGPNELDGTITMRSYSVVYGKTNITLQPGLSFFQTCMIRNQSKIQCTDQMGNPVGSSNQTACALVYNCCYNQYEKGGQHNAPACYAQTRESLQSIRTYPYEGVLSRPYEGQGIAYPPYVAPGNVVQKIPHSVGQPGSPGGNNVVGRCARGDPYRCKIVRERTVVRPCCCAVFTTTTISRKSLTVVAVRRVIYNGWQFSLYLHRRNYSEAEAECSKIGARLLMIPSADVQSAVDRHLKVDIEIISNQLWEGPWAEGYWVGGKDSASEGTWLWSNGDKIPLRGQSGFQNWYAAPRIGYFEPDQTSMEDVCLYVNARETVRFLPPPVGKWFDGRCSMRKFFICQRRISAAPCSTNSCLNNGACRNTGGTATCVCRPGYAGSRCQIPPRVRNPPTPPPPTTTRPTALPPKTSEPSRPSGWYAWSGWTECSVTCGKGVQAKIRCCRKGLPGRPPCVGKDREEQECDAGPCVGWNPWLPWNGCSATCGGGFQRRSRACSAGNSACPGDSTAYRVCSTPLCPTWSPWGKWCACSASCGEGTRSRTRSCENAQDQDACPGESVQREACAMGRCPSWGSWSPYGDCSASCGGGIQCRTRLCVGGSIGDNGCDDVNGAVMSQTCNLNDCDSWAEWGDFGPCSATCGTGRYSRTRTCLNGTPGVGGCPGSGTDTQSCQAPVNCWGEWAEYGDCTVTCGGGVQTRTRVCIGEAEVECMGSSSQSISCNEQVCETWGPWSEADACSVTCGGGVAVRTRICSGGSPGSPGCQGSSRRKQDCNEQACPVWSEWTPYSECSVTCGDGERRRTRTCLPAGTENSLCGGPSEDSSPCSPACLGPWTPFGPCSSSCGGGIRRRSRVCIGGRFGEPGCDGDLASSETCEMQRCPSWSPWTSGDCESIVRGSNCGPGMVQRARQCIGGNIGDIGCEGRAVVSESCDLTPCPLWSPWGPWGACSATCGGGSQQRARSCVNGVAGDAGCPGRATEDQNCNQQTCPRCLPVYEDIGIDFGFVVCTNGNHLGSVCTFTCRSDYQVVGVNRLTCAENAAGVVAWSSEAPVCSPRCTDQADIVLVLDSSSSIGVTNFQTMRIFLDNLINRFNVGPNAALFGAIRYNSEVNELWNLNDYNNKADVLQAVTLIPYEGFGTLTGNAINYTHNNMFLPSRGRRRGVPKIVVVITDGISYDNVTIPSRILKADNTLVLAVGIGKVDINEINEIASDPDENFATTVADFNSLNKIVNTISDQIKLCQTPVVNFTQCPTTPVMDVVFIVDGSGSIGSANFEIMRNFIIRMVEVFQIGPSFTQVGFIRYNTAVDERFKLSSFNNTADTVAEIRAVPYDEGGTNTGQAMQYAANNAFRGIDGRRPEVPAVAIVMTDGQSQDDVREAAQALRIKAQVIAVGIRGADQEELNQIVGQGGASNVFTIDDFAALDGQIDRITTAVCFAGRGGRVVIS